MIKTVKRFIDIKTKIVWPSPEPSFSYATFTKSITAKDVDFLTEYFLFFKKKIKLNMNNSFENFTEEGQNRKRVGIKLSWE